MRPGALLIGLVPALVAAAEPDAGPVGPPAPPAILAPPPVVEDQGVDAFDPTSPPDAETLVRIAGQVNRQREDLRRRELDLKRREVRLQGLEQEVEAQYEALRLLQEELSAKVKAMQSTAPPPPTPEDLKKQAARVEEKEANVQQLARVFEKMKPAEASKVVPQMEEDLAVEVLARLKERQAAKILGGIEPELAGRLTKKLVERRKREVAEKK